MQAGSRNRTEGVDPRLIARVRVMLNERTPAAVEHDRILGENMIQWKYTTITGLKPCIRIADHYSSDRVRNASVKRLLNYTEEAPTAPLRRTRRANVVSNKAA